MHLATVARAGTRPSSRPPPAPPPRGGEASPRPLVADELGAACRWQDAGRAPGPAATLAPAPAPAPAPALAPAPASALAAPRPAAPGLTPVAMARQVTALTGRLAEARRRPAASAEDLHGAFAAALALDALGLPVVPPAPSPPADAAADTRTQWAVASACRLAGQAGVLRAHLDLTAELAAAVAAAQAAARRPGARAWALALEALAGALAGYRARLEAAAARNQAERDLAARWGMPKISARLLAEGRQLLAACAAPDSAA